MKPASPPLISVIVPIYQMEHRMDRCMECLLAQTYPALEFLLVDDGSTDGSWERMQRWAGRDPRFRLFRKENGGVSSARNLGLAQMRGAYGTFVDPDDAFSAHLIAWLYDALQQAGTSLSVCRVLTRPEAEHLISLPEPAAPGPVACVPLDAYDPLAATAHVQCYAALYRADLLRQLRFDERLACAEDLLFFTQALLAAGAVACLPDRLYYYTAWSRSALHGGYTPAQYADVLVWAQLCGRVCAYPRFLAGAQARYVLACTRAFYYSLTGSADCAPLRRDAVRRLRGSWRTVLRLPSACRSTQAKALLALSCPPLAERLWRLRRRFSSR